MKIDLSIDYIRGFRKIGCMITLFGVLQFFLLTFKATFFYPGGDDYLEKPFEISDLKVRIDKILNSKNTTNSK